MKKLSILALAAVLVIFFTLPAAALENEFGGYWLTRFYTQKYFSGFDRGDRINREDPPGRAADDTVEVADGILQPEVYPDLYDYRNLGLAVMDVASPNASYYTHYGYLMRSERRTSSTTASSSAGRRPSTIQRARWWAVAGLPCSRSAARPARARAP